MDSEQQKPPGQRLGKGMWIAAWVMGLAVLTLMFGQQEQQWRNPNQQPQSQTTENGIREVKLKRNRQGHYVVTGFINDKPADFLLDTGATDVVIPSKLAGKFGLKQGRAGFASTANGTVKVYETMISRLRIGDIVLRDVRANINPNMDGHILLGMSALRQVEFIQRDNELTLKQYPGSP